MKRLKELLLEEQQRLEKIVTETKNHLKDAPTGTLRMSKSHDKLQYYRCTREKKSGIYINRNNFGLARKLAQKTYDEKVLKLAEKRLSQIQKITKDYDENEIEKIYFAKSMVKKIQAYENNEIFQGERLILTYETETTILNTGKIEQLAKRYLI